MKLIRSIIKRLVYWVALVVPHVIAHRISDLCWAIFGAYRKGIGSIRPFIRWLISGVLFASLNSPIMSNAILLMMNLVKIHLSGTITHKNKTTEILKGKDTPGQSTEASTIHGGDLSLIAKMIKTSCDSYFESCFHQVALIPMHLRKDIEEVLNEYAPSSLLAPDDLIPMKENISEGDLDKLTGAWKKSKTPTGMAKLVPTLGLQRTWSIAILRQMITVVDASCTGNRLSGDIVENTPHMTKKAMQSAIGLLKHDDKQQQQHPRVLLVGYKQET